MSDRGPTRKPLLFREFGDQFLALISQVALNGSFFLIMFVASMKLETSEF